jgi:hypothetical protein
LSTLFWIVNARQRQEGKKKSEVNADFDLLFYIELGLEVLKTGELVQRSQIRGSRESSSDESSVGGF